MVFSVLDRGPDMFVRVVGHGIAFALVALMEFNYTTG